VTQTSSNDVAVNHLKPAKPVTILLQLNRVLNDCKDMLVHHPQHGQGGAKHEKKKQKDSMLPVLVRINTCLCFVGLAGKKK